VQLPVRRKLLGILSTSLLIAGCGSTKVVTVLTTVTTRQIIAARATGGARVVLPASSHGEQCIVSNGAGQIIFYSQIVQVAPLCQAQVRQPGWKQGGESVSPTNRELLICYLRNTTATVVASVFDAAAGKVGSRACSNLIAGHAWIDAQARPPR
jgi:hypothetical protein